MPSVDLPQATGPGDADDLPPAGGQIQAGEQRRVTGIAAGEIPDLQTLHPAGGNGGHGGDLPHQGLDPLPGHLRLVDCVEQLCRLGGFGGQLGKAGQKRGEFRDGPDRPAGAQHVFPAEIQDQRRPDHGEHTVQRRQGRCPQVCLYSGVFVSGEVLLIGYPALLLPAKDPVGQGVDRRSMVAAFKAPACSLKAAPVRWTGRFIRSASA